MWNIMMNERKLDINAPLMSVRRSSAASPSLTEAEMKVLERKRHTFPSNKSDLSLDQVTEPVAVPFNWEHIPGMAKGDGGSQPQPHKEASITPIPSLPPGRYTNVAKQPQEKEYNGANKPNSLSKLDCERERKDEKIRSNGEENDDDDDDDVYSDALETLSSTESLSMNCSASGVSGLDNLDAKRSGTNATDKQTQDFMMSRFLPAAKAMTSHPPQYASSRKHSVLVEQPRDVIRLVREERKSIVKKHITDIVPYTGQYQEDEEGSSDEADDYDNSTSISAKGCGMFPRLCDRNSLCLLNPVPGMKLRNQYPMSSAYDYEKPNKTTHTPAIKKAWDAIHKSKSSSGAASPDKNDKRKKWTSGSNRFTYSGEMKPQGRLSPFHRSRAAAAATTSNFQSKPQPLFPRAMLHCDSKQAEKNQSGNLRFPSQGQGSIQEVLSESSSSRSLANEKTLYIDTVSTSRLSCSSSCSVDKNKRVGTMVAVLDNRAGKERSSIIESFQGTNNLTDLGENLDSEVSASGEEDKDERLTTDQEPNQESMSIQLVQSSHDKDTKINKKQIVAVDNPGKVGAELVVSHLPPPLPKSPSDSWLSRALPLVYMKNPFLHSNQDTKSLSKRQGFNASSRYTKWETIVKTSNLNLGHVSYSKEITVYKPQHSKS